MVSPRFKGLPSELPQFLIKAPYVSLIQSSYGICIDLYQDVKRTGETSLDRKIQERDLMYCRVLGYLLIYAPTEAARLHVHNGIMLCADSRELIELGKFYYSHYIRTFRSARRRTPVSSSPSSRPSFDGKPITMKPKFIESHADAKALALIRDGYRCVITGKYDIESIERNQDVFKEYKKFGKDPSATQCAHIIPESINTKLGDLNKKAYAAKIWAIFANFGYTGLRQDLHHNNVHRLENILTLDSSVRTLFDSLKLWFSATETTNQYKVETVMDYNIPPFVTFTSARPDLPLPSPEYLRLHAACAEVAHFSGAGEFIENVLENLESIPVLSEDGSSANLLEDALLYAQTQPLRVSLIG